MGAGVAKKMQVGVLCDAQRVIARVMQLLQADGHLAKVDALDVVVDHIERRDVFGRENLAEGIVQLVHVIDGVDAQIDCLGCRKRDAHRCDVLGDLEEAFSRI